MMNVYRSHHCCGIYEMKNVNIFRPRDELIEDILKQARTIGQGKLPRMIQFSDTPYGYGEKWMKFLIEQGYVVHKFILGKNPKTGNELTLYHWYPSKRVKGPSLVREYEYGKQEQQSGVSELGGAARKGGRKSILRGGVGGRPSQLKRAE